MAKRGHSVGFECSASPYFRAAAAVQDWREVDGRDEPQLPSGLRASRKAHHAQVRNALTAAFFGKRLRQSLETAEA